MHSKKGKQNIATSHDPDRVDSVELAVILLCKSRRHTVHRASRGSTVIVLRKGAEEQLQNGIPPEKESQRIPHLYP